MKGCESQGNRLRGEWNRTGKNKQLIGEKETAEKVVKREE